MVVRKVRNWITEKISHNIKKNKVYMSEDNISEILEQPDFIIEMATKLKFERKERLIAQNKVNELEETIIINKPYTNLGKSIANSSGTITVGQYAKLLNNDNIKIGRNRLFKLLRENGYLIANGKEKNMPKQKYLDQGLFKITERTSDKPNREKISTTTLITGKGQLYFKERIKNRG